VSALGNQSKTYLMPWKRFMNFINDIQTSPNLLLMELIIGMGGDVMDVNATWFINLNVHPSLIINLYLTFNLILVHF
jgi:hypothetical protein